MYIESLSPSQIKVQIGSRIKVRRIELKISQNSLAKTIGVSKSAMSHYEAGTLSITCERLAMISSALDEPDVAYFLDGLVRFPNPAQPNYRHHTQLEARLHNLPWSHKQAVLALIHCLERGVVHPTFLDYSNSLQVIMKSKRHSGQPWEAAMEAMLGQPPIRDAHELAEPPGKDITTDEA